HNVSIIGHGLIDGHNLSHGQQPSTKPTTQKSILRRFGTTRHSSTRPTTRRSHGHRHRHRYDSGETRPSTQASTQPSDDDIDVVDVPPGDPANLDTADYGTVLIPKPPSTQPTTQPATKPAFEYPNDKDTLPAGVGNKSIALKNCNDVIIRDISIVNGGHFAILATGVNGLTIDDVKLDTDRDGMDIDSCQNVRVSNCTVNSPDDDGICLKTSLGLGTTRPTENVTISNCLVTGGYQIGSVIDGTFKKFTSLYADPQAKHMSRTGRIKFGTESNGDYKNITISNCVFDDCSGLALESVDGAIIENVTISNISMRNIDTLPIFIRLGDRLRGPKDTTTVGAIRHIIISNVVATNAASHFACLICGIPGHPIEDVSISNVKLYFPGGGTTAMATTRPIEKEDQYPEPTMFGTLPAWGFYVRHVDLLQMDHVDLVAKKPDTRPAFMLIDVKDAQFDHVRVNTKPGVPTFIIDGVGHISMDHFQGEPDMDRYPTTQQSF
ncbi:MAG TPA: glycosyl hydrolase family 28 protein, partial [Tepidisphaeraceae bacterium]|nr:glycosyl hydrolase family 28 protein [Tepidisphaeraceae bacterium]